MKSKIVRFSAFFSAIFVLFVILALPCFADSLTYCLFYTTASDVVDASANLPLEGVEELDCFIIRCETLGIDWESYNPITFTLIWDGGSGAMLVSSDYSLTFTFPTAYYSVELGVRTYDPDILSNYIGSDFDSSSDKNASWYPSNPNPPSYPFVECDIVNLGYNYNTESYTFQLRNVVGFNTYSVYNRFGSSYKLVGTFNTFTFTIDSGDFLIDGNGNPFIGTYFTVEPLVLPGFTSRTFDIYDITPPQFLVPSSNTVVQNIFAILKTNPVQDVLNWIIPAVGTLVLLAFVIRKL